MRDSPAAFNAARLLDQRRAVGGEGQVQRLAGGRAQLRAASRSASAGGGAAWAPPTGQAQLLDAEVCRDTGEAVISSKREQGVVRQEF